jgi:hypothetical protein
MRLLTINLSAAQREQYKAHRYFEVIGGDTGRLYRIWYDYQINVEQVDEVGRGSHWLCFAPEGRLPIGDVMLAQKIALEVFESEALKIANRVLGSWNYVSDVYLNEHVH